jgi:hypothetical protein
MTAAAPSSRASARAFERVDDDRRRSRADGGEQRHQADAARAEDRDGLSRLHVRGVEDGAQSGERGAAEDRGELERDVVGDRDERLFGADRALAETGDAEVMVDGAAGQTEARLAAQHLAGLVRSLPRYAESGASGGAHRAGAAGRYEREDDVLARDDRRDAGPDRFDDAGGLVAERDRETLGDRPVDAREVRVAQARARDADDGFAAPGRVEFDLFDCDRTAARVRAR